MFYNDYQIDEMDNTSKLYAVVVTDAENAFFDPVMAVCDEYQQAVRRAVECNNFDNDSYSVVKYDDYMNGNYELIFTVSNKEVTVRRAVTNEEVTE